MTSFADVFVCDTHNFDERDVAALLSLLSDDERDRQSRLGFANDRRDYVVSHALLRISLGDHLDVPAPGLRIATTQFGKPFLVATGPDAATTSFSLSHSRGLAACGFSDSSPLGVDVEVIDSAAPVLSIANLSFSPDEAASLGRYLPSERAARFCELWSLKEAYSKAIGLGLGQSLREPSFEVTDGVAHAADAPQWDFHLEALMTGHMLAVATHRGVAVHVHHADREQLVRRALSLRAVSLPAGSVLRDAPGSTSLQAS